MKVLTTVAGVDGPAVMERGILTTTQQRCLRHDHFVSVEIPVDFVRLDEPGPRVQYLSSAPQSQMPGCNLASSVYTLPPTVTEGTWRLEGITRSNKTSELRFWSSQPFKVVTAENPR